MIRIYKNIIFFLLALFVLACAGKKSIIKEKTAEDEVRYYDNFIQATRQVLLFGNYKDAIKLYSECIREYPMRAAPYFQMSNIYISVNDINKAKYFGKMAIELNDSNEWYLLNLANIYQYENNIDSLIIIYKRIVELTDNPEYKYNLSVLYAKKGDNANSMNIIKMLEKELAGSREILIMKHNNFNALNLKDSAVFELKELIKLFPDDIENYRLLAEYFSEINKLDSAEDVYKEMLTINPYAGTANISYGNFLMHMGLKDSALIYFSNGFKADDIGIEDKIGILFNFLYDQNALNNDTVLIESLIDILKNTYSNDPRPNTIAAEYLTKRQKFKEASDELKLAIDKGSTAYIVWEQYMMINNYLGNHQAVKDIYETAIAKFPLAVKFYIYASFSLYQLGEYKNVLNLSNRALNNKKIELGDRVQIYNLMADSYRLLKDYAKSDSTFEEILKLDPANLTVRNNYSYYLSLRSEKLERAEELSKYTIEKEPENPTYLDTYGWILYKKGNSTEAIKYIERAIKNGAYTNAEVLEHYGDIMSELGRCSEAIEAWSEAQKYNASVKSQIDEKIKSISEKCCSK